jgi:hypothetical protein
MSGKKSPSTPHKANPPAASGDPSNDPARRQACIDLAGGDEPMLFIDRHDDAIIGVADRDGDDVVVYDTQKIIKGLRRRDGMSKQDAEEFFAYNISNTCAGAGTPIFVECFSN